MSGDAMFNLCFMPNICDHILTSVEETILNPAGTCFKLIFSPVLRSIMQALLWIFFTVLKTHECTQIMTAEKNIKNKTTHEWVNNKVLIF